MMWAADRARTHRARRDRGWAGGDTLTTIGVVGLGAMGGRIAGRLLSQDNTVYGTNRTRAKADLLIEQGLLWCDSPRKVAEAADIVFVVTGSDVLELVTNGPDGTLAGLAAGKVCIDMSTVTPRASLELAELVAARGASMLAAPVAGSVTAAEEGRLVIIVGGDAGAFERVAPILRRLGSTGVTFVGDNSQAQLLKLATNVSLAVQMLAYSEGVRLAEHAGIKRNLALDVLTRSAIGGPTLQSAPLELTDRAWFDVHELLSAARVLGYEHRDIALLFQVFSEMIAAPTGGEPGLSAA